MQLNKSILIFLFLFISLNGIAQVKFYAEVDAEEVLENSTLEVNFVIENAQGNNFTPPNFTGFQVINGPRTSNQTSIINNRRSSKQSFGYTLRPLKKGKLTIGKASVLVNNKKQYSAPIKISVVKTDNSKPDFYVDMELSDSTAYPGQQVIVKYVLHYALTKKISSIDIRTEDEFEGFFATRLNDRQEQAVQSTIAGRKWVSQTVRKIALFPQTLGDYDFRAADFVIRIPDPSRGSVFFNGFREEYTTSNKVRLKVSPLKVNDPYFCGAVGKYECAAYLSKTTINTDQSFALTLKITGDGDPKLIRPPALRLSDSLEVYDPNILKEEQMVIDGRQQHRTTYEYLITADHPGNYTIVPSLTYFDVDSNAIVENKTIPYKLRVVKGSGLAQSESATLAQRSDKMAQPIKNVSLAKSNKSFFNSSIFWILSLLFLLGFPSLAFLKYRDIQKGKIDPNQTKYDQARRVAEEKLKTAHQFMQLDNQKAFYDEVSKSIFGYVSDKLQMKPSELSTSNISDKLNELGVSPDPIAQITDILKSCELSLFAGSNESDKMPKMYELTLETISQIEKEITATRSS